MSHPIHPFNELKEVDKPNFGSTTASIMSDNINSVTQFTTLGDDSDNNEMTDIVVTQIMLSPSHAQAIKQ